VLELPPFPLHIFPAFDFKQFNPLMHKVAKMVTERPDVKINKKPS